MTPNAAKILEEARQLPSADRDWLIGEMLQEGDGSSKAEIDASWKAEVERRVAEAEGGTGVSHSWEEVVKRLFACIGSARMTKKRLRIRSEARRGNRCSV